MNDRKEVTIYDIAIKLSISPATVSRALNNNLSVNKKTVKKIHEAAKEMGYRSNLFAKNLRNQKTHTIGVIVHTLNSNFISSVLSGIERVANKSGYNLIITQSQETELKEVANAETLFNSRVDGLIVSLAFNTKHLTHFDPFFEKNIPVIFFDRVSYGKSSTNVVIDNFKAGYEATSHLLEQGCQKIAHITGSLSRNVYADRMKGYRQALEENNIFFDEKYLIVTNMEEQSVTEAARELLALDPMPDGIFIANDICAAICMQALKEAHYSIPEDIAIVGFNNDIISRIVNPHISTINYPGEKMGEIVAHSMVNHLEGIAPLNTTGTIVIKSELIVRNSSVRNGRKQGNEPGR